MEPPIKQRLKEIFLSQKFIMYALALAFTAVFVPADGRQTCFVTATGTFGAMKTMDYVRAAWSSRKAPDGPGGEAVSP
jgi:hypothetical protein